MNDRIRELSSINYVEQHQEFYTRFDMRVNPSQRRLRRINQFQMKTNPWTVKISDDTLYQDLMSNVEEVECVDILMPKDRLDSLVSYIHDMDSVIKRLEKDREHSQRVVAKLERDKIVRRDYPQVQKAYEHYITLLELCRG